MYKIAFIGAGNLAWHVAPELENAGHQVVAVASRTTKSATRLVQRLYNAEVKKDLDFSGSEADAVIIAVPDDSIEETARELAAPDRAVVVHVSGSRPMEILDYTAAQHTGVFYPLQSFTIGKKVDFSEIPVLIEGSDRYAISLLNDLARSITKRVFQVDGRARKAAHVAGVFANNLANRLIGIAEEILIKEKLSLDLIKPLIAETITKCLALGPKAAQTGPAIREDLETLDLHMEFLKSDPDYAEIYRLISQDIINKK